MKTFHRGAALVSCRSSLVAIASAVVLTACGSSSSNGTGEPDPRGDDPGLPAGTSSGGFSLRVDKAGLSANLGGLAPADGNAFLVLDVTLSNGSITPALSQGASFFTVTTVPVLLSGGIITVELTGKNGVIAGASEATALASAFAPTVGCSLGGRPDAYLETFVGAADLVTGGRHFQDPSRECDAVSIGLGFTMKKVQPPTTIEPPTTFTCE